MPDFWEFPTVSMGLGPIMAIYQARFNEYLRDRGIKDTSQQKVWAFLGDGECDEPEAFGAITLASREKLQNLIFVINCNLQRLDGPVRGNGKIIQELEALFRGTGWNVIKVIWGDDWDPLLEKDEAGLLVKRMDECVDGQYQKYTAMPGSYIREHFFGKYPEVLKLVEKFSDEKLEKMRRGGHDPEKVYAAYKSAMESEDRPTVILAKTIKGYGLGEGGEGLNIAHQKKKADDEELREFRSRFGIPVSDEQIAVTPFYRPADDSSEIRYLKARRKKLGGYLPSRPTTAPKIEVPRLKNTASSSTAAKAKRCRRRWASCESWASSAKTRRLASCRAIVPDESRTFGMEGMFRKIGIYSHAGQLYEPVDTEQLLTTRRRGRPDSGRRDHRSRLDVVVHRRRHGVLPARREHDPVLHLLLDVRLPADRRLDLGGRRLPAKGFLMGGTAGGRRSTAKGCSTRTATAC